MNGALITACGLLLSVLSSCATQEVTPVDLYPEDECSHCRMTVSDPRFAAEIITVDGEVFKFDDIGCMEAYQLRHPEIRAGGVFVMDFDSATWLSAGKATIISTEVSTPMGSGKLAFNGREASERFLAQYGESGQ